LPIGHLPKSGETFGENYVSPGGWSKFDPVGHHTFAAQPADGASLAGELSKSMPRGKAFAELFSIQRSTQQMSFECEVLPDQTKARRN
jgi:hypothetical protein